MKSKVECEDSIRLKKKEGGSVREFGLNVIVTMESKKVAGITFYQSNYYEGKFIYIPVDNWAEVKDKVDRLIIRVEELWKEN